MTKWIVVLAASVMILTATQSVAEEVKPVQLSLFNPIQIFDEDTSIKGVRLSIYGVNQNMTGVDWGVVPVIKGDFLGWQNGGVCIVKGNMQGYQNGFVNVVNGDFTGFQWGILNVSEGMMSGVQFSFLNLSGNVEGIQCGVGNVAESLHGLQIGFINVNKSGTPHRFFPIVNWAF